jgi:hypothetical protein
MKGRRVQRPHPETQTASEHTDRDTVIRYVHEHRPHARPLTGQRRELGAAGGLLWWDAETATVWQARFRQGASAVWQLVAVPLEVACEQLLQQARATMGRAHGDRDRHEGLHYLMVRYELITLQLAAWRHASLSDQAIERSLVDRLSQLSVVSR